MSPLIPTNNEYAWQAWLVSEFRAIPALPAPTIEDFDFSEFEFVGWSRRKSALRPAAVGRLSFCASAASVQEGKLTTCGQVSASRRHSRWRQLRCRSYRIPAPPYLVATTTTTQHRQPTMARVQRPLQTAPRSKWPYALAVAPCGDPNDQETRSNSCVV